ncbi:plant cysteine oxidase 4-like [Selaginella moellendorffii]|uniref:plant cysteine oxidase 4-like n=1 Tax=Selaginella moellendorffii TaxID=88036 RepID=UPI000D1CDF39|nr:plant cysteine oxidase 4-like [Selaginella moellendorffii]|eukprot:XP_024519529.1 plant cysteine oxidase 4-like [Selaginella moellendorffii]
MTAMTAVQKLYEVCKASFSCVQGVPAPEAVARVRAVLDDIKCSDLGLQEDNCQRNGRSTDQPPESAAPAITYLHLYECNKFSMGIFCLPQSAALPLHNHPGMTVLSKLIYGSMHVKSYDWVDPSDHTASSTPRLAMPVKDHVLVAPCDTAVLYPTSGGNIHSFTAVTSCAVLDVLAPPYHTTAGRPCVYYRLAAATSPEATDSAEAHLVHLQEFRPSSEFVVHRGNYRGPKVVPSI